MMLQDIAPHRLHNQYDPYAEVDAVSRLIVFDGKTLLCRTQPELDFPKVMDLPDWHSRKLQYLFAVDEEKYFFIREERKDVDVIVDLATSNHPEPFAFHDLKFLRESEPSPKYRVFAAYTARHLMDWYRDFAYCGRCGQPMEHSLKERAMCCKACGNTAYPRIMPAVIVGVKNGNRLLLTRYRNGYNHNALIAGFTEIGETVEETVHREVLEEAGIHVKNLTYYKSQPWGVAGDILMGYYCDVDGDDTISMDGNELKYAEWVRREDIVLQPDASSLTNEMMKRFQDGVEY